MNSLKSIIKSDSLWTQVVGTLVAALALAIITLIIGLIRGLDLNASIEWVWNLANINVNIITLVIIIVVIVLISRRYIQHFKSELKKEFVLKEDFNKKMSSKLESSTFDIFTDVCDYRRLKNHPWHEIYTDRNSDIQSFKDMIWAGKYKNDEYKIENGIRGLISLISENKCISSSTKTDIMNELQDCYPNKFNSDKEELISLLNTVETY